MLANIKFIVCDKVIVVVLSLLGVLISYHYISTYKGTAQFYQKEFAPAVMYACGHGFVMPAVKSKALEEFLAQKKVSFDCGKLPADTPTGSLNMFQASHMYLLKSMGMIWRVSGVSWKNIIPLYVFFYVLSMVAVYGIVRLVSKPIIAAIVTIVIFVHTDFLLYLPHFRDFSKAPFILAIIYFMGVVVRHHMIPRKLFVISLLLGVLTGIGIGFRIDPLIMVPAILATIVFFIPGGIVHNLNVKLISGALFFLSFLLFGWPILEGAAGKGNLFHVILLGLMSPFDQALDIGQSIYEFGYYYNDTYVSKILNSFNYRVYGGNKYLDLATKEYEQAGFRYYLTILKNFPSDILTRYYAAVINIVDRPYFILITLSIISVINLRVAIYVLLLILYLSGYPSLQFDKRHYFHLQFIPYWFFAIWITWGVSAVKYLVRNPRIILGRYSIYAWLSLDKVGIIAIRPALYFVAVLMILVGTLWGLRVWQTANLNKLFDKYYHVDTERILFKRREDRDENTVFIDLSGVTKKADAAFWLRTHYWLVEFDNSHCGQDRVLVNVVYEAPNSYDDMSFSVALDISQSTKYFFATYSDQRTYFKGINMLYGTDSCLTKISLVRKLAHFPLLLNLLLSKDWKKKDLYQKFGRMGETNRAHASGLVQYLSSPVLSRKTVDALVKKVQRVSFVGAILYSPDIVSEKNGRVLIKGVPKSRFAYLWQLPEHKIDEAGYFVVEGVLLRGGVSLGIIKNGKWYRQVGISKLGRFRVVFGAEKGMYVGTLASNLQKIGENELIIYKMGWVRNVEKDNMKK